nr:helix-turn-helix transcriptional regulator [Escherichia coli]
MFAGKKSAQIREILISESAWEEMTCLFAPSLIQSILSSGIIRFSDKLIKILDQDLSKRWRLGDIAEIFNVSEVSIRKRLDAEQTTFYQILYERKMNKALQLLLDNELQVDLIAKKIGISSTSYFIKSFKKHFGVTPKSFLMYFR